MSAMREFDWSYELGMYAGTATGILIIAVVVGGLVLLVQSLFRGRRHGEKIHDR